MQNFYDFYVGSRITGFMSHWMTFGGEEMIVLLLLAAYLVLLRSSQRWKIAGWFCAAILVVSMILGYTRSIFLLGFPIGLLYLLWFWHKWLVAAAPVVALHRVSGCARRLAGARRLRSFSRTAKPIRTCTEPSRAKPASQMIRAHPWFGLGPEQVKAQFEQWVPASVARPLPTGWYGHLHNIYLQYAAERGVPTMLVLMWMIGKILWDFAQRVARADWPVPRRASCCTARSQRSSRFSPRASLSTTSATAKCSRCFSR